jgi:hypothetical protein
MRNVVNWQKVRGKREQFLLMNFSRTEKMKETVAMKILWTLNISSNRVQDKILRNTNYLIQLSIKYSSMIII